MESVMKTFIRARESVVRKVRGQTLTEYALMLTAIAAAVLATYRALGDSTASLATGLDSDLTNA